MKFALCTVMGDYTRATYSIQAPLYTIKEMMGMKGKPNSRIKHTEFNLADGSFLRRYLL